MSSAKPYEERGIVEIIICDVLLGLVAIVHKYKALKAFRQKIQDRSNNMVIELYLQSLENGDKYLVSGFTKHWIIYV